MKRLSSVDELNSEQFRAFMAWLNGFACVHGLRIHTNWSKIWEYPWTWQYLSGLTFPHLRILDIGSEICPMPWFFTSLGAHVSMIETEKAHATKWRELKEKNGFDIRWDIVSGPLLPLPDDTFDVVTSYSVLEHIPDKDTALNEAIRVLKPGGLLCLTFDICEQSLGMTFPEWNGTALDMETFDRLVWHREELRPVDPEATWNVVDIESFLQWHRHTASHHNYVVGGALLRKRMGPNGNSLRTKRVPIRVHQLDTGLGSGNTGDDAMFLAAHAQLPPEFELTTEVHSLERTAVFPRGVRYLSRQDTEAVIRSIRTADLALLVGDTPVMDQWGLEWPLRANAAKLQLCHQLGKPVHAIGVGVDQLTDPEARHIFRECYAPIASWSVRTPHCRAALLELGIPGHKIALGADWAWLLPPSIDKGWAGEWLRQCGADQGKVNIGINLVNEIWQDNQEMKEAWAALLDRLVDKLQAQVVFFCNESRPGAYFDRAAADDVRARMRRASILLADRYYQPAEMISLISLMSVTISQRYHFTVFSVLADVYPVSIERGQKMRGLMEELELPYVGNMERIDEAGIQRELEKTLMEPVSRLRPLRDCRKRMEARAHNNLVLLNRSLSGIT